jgi:hypothetical protein
MPDHAYPAPHRPTRADLDPESATTDALIALAFASHREGQDPTPPLSDCPAHLPAVLRALCDALLAGEVTGLDAAYRLASIIDAVDGAIDPPGAPRRPALTAFFGGRVDPDRPPPSATSPPGV